MVIEGVQSLAMADLSSLGSLDQLTGISEQLLMAAKGLYDLIPDQILGIISGKILTFNIYQDRWVLELLFRAFLILL